MKTLISQKHQCLTYCYFLLLVLRLIKVANATVQLPCRKGPGTHWAPSATLVSAAATCFKRRYSKLDVPQRLRPRFLRRTFLQIIPWFFRPIECRRQPINESCACLSPTEARESTTTCPARGTRALPKTDNPIQAFEFPTARTVKVAD